MVTNWKNNNHIHSIHTEKVSENSLTINLLKTLATEWIYLSIIKFVYDKPTTNIIFNNESWRLFFSKSRNKIRVPTLTILFNQNLFTGKMAKILYSVCRRYSIVLKSTVHTQKNCLKHISSVKLLIQKSIHISQFCFYTIKMNYQRDYKNNLIYNWIKKE